MKRVLPKLLVRRGGDLVRLDVPSFLVSDGLEMEKLRDTIWAFALLELHLEESTFLFLWHFSTL